uniref:LPS-assembly protein LptD n=1 Tax=Candidatus Pelagibacter sp. TaxID=2024849 RepID=UPI003F8645CC
ENKIVGKNIKILDFLENNYFVTDGFINIKDKKLLGKNIRINLKKDTFGNSKNDPRLKGNSVIYGGNNTLIQKGVFTSCQMSKDCSPWHITSKEIIHYKDKEEIHYKNAWLHIYDKPILYFPKFFHPDPSVKRRSGFLTPRVNNNNNLGTSLTLPYFNALSESSDYTITPRIFSHEEFLLQNEYRKLTRNSSHNFDFSINKNKDDNKNGRRTHFFSNSSIKNLNSYFDESSIILNIEKVSNDNYIKEYSLESSSPILKDTEILESHFEFSSSKNDFNLDISVESYETMNKTNNDRYEFVYPNYSLSKLVSLNNSIFDNIDFRSSGSQKKFATNIYEGVQINDVLLSSNSFNSKFGITHNFKTVLKNINSEGEKSSKYKNEFQSEILNLSTYDLSLPLIKKDGNTSDYLTPKLSFRHSPNDTKNIRDNATLLNAGNVFSFNRIGQSDNVEGGSSLTIGLDYEKKKKNKNTNDTFFKHRLAAVFRDNLDENLPTKSTLGKKQSDFIGEAIFNPNDIFSLNYNYLLDKNVNNVNLHNLTNRMKVNNFVGNFTFYEENNLVGKESYYESSIGYTIDNNNLIKFSTRENKKDNLTEFYDLIYEYKNDCLTASIKYNKKYYTNNYLKPSEDLFFTITIIPLGSTQTESVLD